MKSVIKITIISAGIILLSIYFALAVWGSDLAEALGSRILDTEVRVEKARFIPWRLQMLLRGISLPQWQVNFPQATVSLFPLRMNLTGVGLLEKISVPPESFELVVTKRKEWDINLFFQDIDLCSPAWEGIRPGMATAYLKNGFVEGTVRGYYSPEKDKYYLNCNLRFNGLVLAEIESLPEIDFMGISEEDLIEIVESNDGVIVVDFSYSGPADELDQIYNYRPGKKLISLLARQMIKKKLSS